MYYLLGGGFLTTTRMIVREWCKKVIKVEKDINWFTISFMNKESSEKAYNQLMGIFGSALTDKNKSENYYQVIVHKEVMIRLLGKIVMGDI